MATHEGATSAYAVRNPSLELRWLPNSMLKQLPFYPAVIFREGGGGSHYAPALWTPEEIFENEGIDIDTSRGVLVIGTEYEKEIPAVIAHEERHHWQWTNQRYAERLHSWPFQTDRPYWESITKHFSYAPHEYDALRFELSVCPSDVSVEWWIHLEKAKRGFFG